MKERFDNPETWLVAHRGDQGGGVENTLAAFELAARSGARYAECDIQFTRDMVPVVIHDDSLVRLCDLTLNVSQLDMIDLKELCHPYFKLLSLSRLLQWLQTKPQLTLFIEVKPEICTRVKEGEIAVLLAKHIPESLLSRIVLISESVSILNACHSQVNLSLGWVAEGDDKPDSKTEKNLDYLFMHYSKVASIPSWHRQGIKVGLYTVNSAKLAHELFQLGADLIETDRFSKMLNKLSCEHGNN